MILVWRSAYSFFQNLQKTAETAVKDYTYNPNLILNNTEYINVNELKSGPKAQSLKYDPHFRQEINGSESGVHIPIEIYEGCKYSSFFVPANK